MMKIIDCFPFFNELDLLEVRLNSLAPYVDEFVLSEMPVTHRGRRKPLFFEMNKERYKGFKITHLIAPTIDGSSWVLEHYQREYLLNGIDHIAGPEDIILLSDLDEIPNLQDWKQEEGVFRELIYYYYFNVCGNRSWDTTVAFRRKNMRKTLQKVRNHKSLYPVLPYGGWQFSTLGTPEEIVYKVESFAHVELDKPEFKGELGKRRENLLDPFVGGAPNWRQTPLKLTVEMPTGPKWLLENKHRYPHLWLS